MNELALIVGVAVVLAVIAAALVARRTPHDSGGAPGEVSADEPLSEPTGASMEDHDHAGGAEDRPGGPDVEPMDPDGKAVPPAPEQ